MKLGHNKRAALQQDEKDKPPVSRFREWQLGVAAFTIGNVANFLSFGELVGCLWVALLCRWMQTDFKYSSLTHSTLMNTSHHP